MEKIAEKIRESQMTGRKESIKAIVIKIKDRLSFLRIYNIFDQVDSQGDRVNHLESNHDDLKKNLE